MFYFLLRPVDQPGEDGDVRRPDGQGRGPRAGGNRRDQIQSQVSQSMHFKFMIFMYPTIYFYMYIVPNILLIFFHLFIDCSFTSSFDLFEHFLFFCNGQAQLSDNRFMHFSGSRFFCIFNHGIIIH